MPSPWRTMSNPTPRLSDAPLLCALLDRPVPVIVSTASPSGRPQSSVVWVERRGDELAMFFVAASLKVKNLAVNPRIAVLVVDNDTLHAPGVPAYALITGTATLGPFEPDMPDRVARTYGQVDGYQWELPECCTAIVQVDSVVGLGPLSGGVMGGWGERQA